MQDYRLAEAYSWFVVKSNGSHSALNEESCQLMTIDLCFAPVVGNSGPYK